MKTNMKTQCKNNHILNGGNSNSGSSNRRNQDSSSTSTSAALESDPEAAAGSDSLTSIPNSSRSLQNRTENERPTQRIRTGISGQFEAKTVNNVQMLRLICRKHRPITLMDLLEENAAKRGTLMNLQLLRIVAGKKNENDKFYWQKKKGGL